MGMETKKNAEKTARPGVLQRLNGKCCEEREMLTNENGHKHILQQPMPMPLIFP
jgi:hypothetical protein